MTRTSGFGSPAAGTHDRIASVNSDLFMSDGWQQSGRLVLLDFDVAVHSDVPGAIDLIDELYAPTCRPGTAEHALVIGRTFRNGEAGYFTAQDGRVVVRTPAPTVAFSHLVFEANQQAIECSPRLVRIHAGAVAVGRRAIALPGAMGAGKSTLAAGLVAAGLAYLTDEVVAIDPDTGAVVPYAKPISLGVAPAELAVPTWTPGPEARRLLGASGLVPAAALGAVGLDALPLGAVVLPAYVKDEPTRIESVGPADALAAIAAHTFHLDEPGTLVRLGRLVADVPVFRMVSGSLRGAVAAVLDVVGTAVAPA